MFSKIGTGELLVILIVALLVVGPDKLPKLARSVGKAVAGFKRYMNDVTGDLKEESKEFKSISDEVEKLQRDTASSLRETGKELEKATSDAEKSGK